MDRELEMLRMFKSKSVAHSGALKKLQSAVKTHRKGSRQAAAKHQWAQLSSTLRESERSAEAAVIAVLAESETPLLHDLHDLALTQQNEAKSYRLSLLKNPRRDKGEYADLEKELIEIQKELLPLHTQLHDIKTFATLTIHSNDALEATLSKASSNLAYVDPALVDVFSSAISEELRSTKEFIGTLKLTEKTQSDRIEPLMKGLSMKETTRGEILIRLGAAFPDTPKAVLSEELWMWERKRYSKQTLRATILDAETRIQNILNALQTALEERCDMYLTEEKLRIAREEREAKSEARQLHIAQLREKHQQQVDNLQLKALEKEADEELLRAAEETLKDAEFKKRLVKLAEHRSRQEEERFASYEAARQRQREEAETHAVLSRRNSERVAFRTEEYYEKQHEKHLNLIQRTEAESARLSLLDDIAKSVAPEVQRSALRAVSGTASSLCASDPQLINEIAKVQIGGFTNEQVLKDKRFKLTEALSKAGLLNTEYAREVISGAMPRKASNAGLLTTKQNPLQIG